mmetsp:Transcript_66742/g.168436  ORF Transcript_66742/g.168436 Transcript_66742/m.168436 type:complete len:255 (-) Transcript_66742:420-1184(-)
MRRLYTCALLLGAAFWKTNTKRRWRRSAASSVASTSVFWVVGHTPTIVSSEPRTSALGLLLCTTRRGSARLWSRSGPGSQTWRPRPCLSSRLRVGCQASACLGTLGSTSSTSGEGRASPRRPRLKNAAWRSTRSRPCSAPGSTPSSGLAALRRSVARSCSCGGCLHTKAPLPAHSSWSGCRGFVISPLSGARWDLSAHCGVVSWRSGSWSHLLAKPTAWRKPNDTKLRSSRRSGMLPPCAPLRRMPRGWSWSGR